MVALQIVANPMGSRVIGGCYNHPSPSNKAKFKILSRSVYFIMLEYVRDKNFEITINPFGDIAHYVNQDLPELSHDCCLPPVNIQKDVET